MVIVEPSLKHGIVTKLWQAMAFLVPIERRDYLDANEITGDNSAARTSLRGCVEGTQGMAKVSGWD